MPKKSANLKKKILHFPSEKENVEREKKIFKRERQRRRKNTSIVERERKSRARERTRKRFAVILDQREKTQTNKKLERESRERNTIQCLCDEKKDTIEANRG